MPRIRKSHTDGRLIRDIPKNHTQPNARGSKYKVQTPPSQQIFSNGHTTIKVRPETLRQIDRIMVENKLRDYDETIALILTYLERAVPKQK